LKIRSQIASDAGVDKPSWQLWLSTVSERN
jgi:hypothetical protein